MHTKRTAPALEIKELKANGYVVGYASVFNEVDAQGEKVARGAFTQSLTSWKKQGRNPPMLWMHDVENPIGIWEKLREDHHGLLVEGMLAIKTQGGADAYELLKMGAVTGLSIGYKPIRSYVEAHTKTRILTELDLFEVSLVTFPANAQARVARVKTPFGHHSFDTAENETRDIVFRLRAMARALKK